MIALVAGLVWAGGWGRTGPVRPATQTPTIRSSPTGTPTPNPRPTNRSTVPAPKPTGIANFSLTSVSYLDAKRGWALGDGRCRTTGRSNCATILRTVDGGAHWQEIGVPAGVGTTKDVGSCGSNGDIIAPCIDQLAFASSTVGYAWSYHQLYLTTNGGASWSDLHSARVRQVIVVGGTAVRMNTHWACSAGCSFGVFAAPVGTNTWHQVIPYSAGGAGEWQLVGSSRVAYLLEQLPNSSDTITPANQVLYRTTDGTHWTRVRGGRPCGAKAIERMALDVAGTLTATCF